MNQVLAANKEKDIFLPQTATILDSHELTELEKYFEIRLDSNQQLGHWPGQFVQVSLPGVGEAPISISSSKDKQDGFEIVVRKVGRLTGALHSLSAGDKIGIRGPYGSPFPVEEAMRGKDILFVAGGIGLVPLRSAIHYVLNRSQNYSNISILYGAKTPAERLFTHELKSWYEQKRVRFLETVDHCAGHWCGHVGVITNLFPELDIDPENTVALVCGPPVMYKFVLKELFARDLAPESIYLSLERRMKCGVGECGHCQINGLYTCLDGPVFKYKQLQNVPEAI